MQHKVRCNDCGHKISLMGNKVNIMCGVTNMIEPLDEPVFCEDFIQIKKQPKK